MNFWRIGWFSIGGGFICGVSTNVVVVHSRTIWVDTWQQSATMSNCGFFCPLETSLTNIDLLTKYWPNINPRDWPEIDKLLLEFIQRELLIWSRSVRLAAASRPKSNWFKCNNRVAVLIYIFVNTLSLDSNWFKCNNSLSFVASGGDGSDPCVARKYDCIILVYGNF